MKDAGKGVFSAYLKWRERHPDGVGFTNLELEAMRSRDTYESPLITDVGRTDNLQIRDRGRARRRVVSAN